MSDLQCFQKKSGQQSAMKFSMDENVIRQRLLDFDQPCLLVHDQGQSAVCVDSLSPQELFELGQQREFAYLQPIHPERLGTPAFMKTYGVRYPYYSGAMANRIASEQLVIAMGKANILSSYGAAGVNPETIEKAILTIQNSLPHSPYMFNLIHNPNEPMLEHRAVDLYLKYKVNTVEASAFLDLTPNIVRYRVSGLEEVNGGIDIKNRVIAKVSLREIGEKFMNPAPDRILQQLRNRNAITEQQAQMASQFPMADDITVEADSGGHTDNRALVNLLPSMIALRDKIQQQYRYPNLIRFGAAGGIGEPQAALAAFMMGAAYIVTDSINQACVEAHASKHTKELLARAEMADIMMDPAADMFEMGVKLQVLKKGTLFPMRAQKLYELYRSYDSLESIPLDERIQLEKKIFQKNLDEVWEETSSFFHKRDPEQIPRAAQHPKRKMALIFRWYLGLSSKWSNYGEAGRELDYQIWCGQAMGAFNDWVPGTYLEKPENRSVADVASQIMRGTLYTYCVNQAHMSGCTLLPSLRRYIPEPSLEKK